MGASGGPGETENFFKTQSSGPCPDGCLAGLQDVGRLSSFQLSVITSTHLLTRLSMN